MASKGPDDFGNVFDERIRHVSREVVEEYVSNRTLNLEVDLTDKENQMHHSVLQRILCKEFISAKEAALLLNCSERHIHNLVDRARRGLSDNPIPYRKIGDTTTFLRTELIEWTKVQPANQLRAVG